MPESEIFFRRGVSRETADGTTVTVTEFVHASTVAEAADEWRLSVDQQRELVEDSGLTAYRMPHEPWA